MNSKILLGIIAVTILGTLATQHIFVQAGFAPIETLQVDGNSISLPSFGFVFSTATCTASHPFLIGGSYSYSTEGPGNSFNTSFDTNTNSFIVQTEGESATGFFQAHALCANFNFPMNMGGMIGGELLDINSVSLLVASIGTNPIITGLVGITIAGISGQTVWFIHKRRKFNR